MSHIAYFLLRLFIMMMMITLGCIGLIRWEAKVDPPVVAEQYGGDVMVYDGVCFIMGTLIRTNDIEAWCLEHGATAVVIL